MLYYWLMRRNFMRVKIWEDIIVVYNENTYYLEECCLEVYVGKLNKILYLICDYPHKHYTFKHFEV